MPVSPAPKPEPVTVTDVPEAPALRLMVIVGLMVKVTSWTPVAGVVGLLALMEWGPPDEGGTVKVAIHAPVSLAESPEATGVPS